MPTQQYKHYQLNFIQLTRNYLCKFENENIIVAGDFNLYLNPKLDKSDSTYNRHDNTNYRVEANALLENLNLSDV